jgi:hypothetical protein
MVSKKVAEQIRYLEAKTRYERILRENKALNEDIWEELKGGLSDIGKALKLTAMDFSSKIWYHMQKTFWVFLDNEKSKAKIREAYQDYKTKHDVIYRDWQPVLKNSMDAINSADPLLTLALAPNFFLANKGIQAMAATGKNAAEIVAAQPWERIINKITDFGPIFGRDDDSPRGPGPRRDIAIDSIADQMRQTSGILFKLQDLFMGGTKKKTKNENVSRNKRLIIEQPEQGQVTDPVEWMTIFLEQTGLNEQFKEIIFELLLDKIKYMKLIMPRMQTILTIKKMVTAESLEEYENILRAAKAEYNLSNDVTDPFAKTIEEMRMQIDQAAEKALAEQEKNSKENNMSAEEIKSKIEKSIFNQGKEQLENQYNKTVSSDIAKIREMHKELGIPNSKQDQMFKYLKNAGSDDANEFNSVYNDYIGFYDKLA